MSRQQRHFAGDHAKLRPPAAARRSLLWPTSRHRIGRQARQYVPLAAMQVKVDGEAGGIAENRDRLANRPPQAFQRQSHVSEGTASDSPRAFESRKCFNHLGFIGCPRSRHK